MKARVICLGVCLSAFGCATQIVPQATGGSRADGVIEFSYQHGAMQKPVIEWGAVEIAAQQRCAAWGYTGAEMFGGSTQACASGSAFGCDVFQVTTSYQCTGEQP